MSEPPGRLDEYISFVSRGTPGTDALGRLAAAANVAAHLTDLADRLLGAYVDEARAAGASWTEIGQSLGVTKQAAQRRFVGNGAGAPPHQSWSPPDWMSAELVTLIERVQVEAREHGNGHISTEHVVLAALHPPDGTPARAVRAIGVEPQVVRDAVIAIMPPPRYPPLGPTERIPFTVRVKELIDARRVAKRLGDALVRPEHVLINVVSGRKNDPVLATLKRLGVTDKPLVTWLARNPT